MGKFILDIPEELHNELRHKSVDEKKDMQELIIDSVKEIIARPKPTKKVNIPKGTSTINFQLKLWNPAHPEFKNLLSLYKGNKNQYNYYFGIMKLPQLGINNEHIHSAGEMLKKIEELYRTYVDSKIK